MPSVYIIAAGSDAGLRRQIILSMSAALIPAAALLVIGALVGAPYQVWIWLVAIVLDLVVVYLTSRGGNWRINSATHFAERHGLVVILALGESVVAIGIGVGKEPVSTSIIVGSVFAVALAVGSWWVYFHHFAPKVEQLVARKTGVERAGLATDVYTYLHMALVAGIVITALGVEQAMHSIEGFHSSGLFGAFALGGGIASLPRGNRIHLAASVGGVGADPAGGATLSLLVIPVLAFLPAIVSLGVIAVIVGVVVGAEQLLGGRARIRTNPRGARPPPRPEHTSGTASIRKDGRMRILPLAAVLAVPALVLGLAACTPEAAPETPTSKAPTRPWRAPPAARCPRPSRCPVSSTPRPRWHSPPRCRSRRPSGPSSSRGTAPRCRTVRSPRCTSPCTTARPATW